MTHETGAPPAEQAPANQSEPGPPTQPVTQSPTPPPRVTVPRWIQLVVLPLALLGLWALARAAGPVLLILIAASTFALILNPLVKILERRGVPRGLSILLTYVALFAVLAGVGLLLSNPVSTQVERFADNVPSIIRHANHDLANFQRFLNRHGIRIQIEHQGQTALQTLEKNVVKNSGSIVSFTRDLLGKLLTISFDLVLVLVLSVYLLVYGRQIGELVRRLMPPGDGTPGDDYPVLVQRAVFSYVRGQLLFSLIMGTSAGVCLWIMGEVGIFPDGARYAIFFGAFYAVMELIPYIGPILGALPAVLVALFTDPITALWVTLLFVALQQLEGHVVAPQVFRISLRINPILVILSLLIGFQIYGVPGALVALPVAAVLRETTIYLRRHLVLESWGQQGATLGLVGSAPSGPDRPSPGEGEATTGEESPQGEEAAPANEPSAEPSPEEEALAGEPSRDASPEPTVTRASPTPPEADVETEPERAGLQPVDHG
jgi:predicted PurR-regulated permease PerM